MPSFLDSHCHPEHADYEGDYAGVLKRAKEAGVERVMAVGGAMKDNEDVLKIASEFPSLVRPLVGLAPHFAADSKKFNSKAENLEAHLAFIEKNHKRISGIGEIGLDWHHYSEDERKPQEKTFLEQCQLAMTLDLVIEIHSRKAEQRVFELLSASEFSTLRVILHCFTKKALASEAKARGWLISLPTSASDDRDKIARKIGLESILCETDSPYLWPSGLNEPKNVVSVYQGVARATGTDIELVADKVWGNAKAAFTNF